MMNYSDGVYAGMAVAAMYSEAFFEKDPRKLVEHSLKVIPSDCKYAQMIRDVLAAKDKYPDWKAAWKVIYKKWATIDGEKPNDTGDVIANGSFVYIGLLYGGGDFWKSMNITMRCGKDSDCNPSSVAGIIGTILGMKAIPEKWAILRNLPIENRAIKDIYPKLIHWDDIINSTVDVGKWNILHSGGHTFKDSVYIPDLKPISAQIE